MFMSDALQLGKPHRTPEGYLAVRARAARAGIQDYLGIEVDPEGKHFAADEVVPVYRPADEVFSHKAVHSYLMKPITNDHPREPVTRDNWSQLSKGVIAKALRDGDDLAFDLVLMDGPTIDAVDAGKVQLSNGYAVDIAIEDGTAPDGRLYKAVQRNQRGNHIAIVDRGRAGPEYRIGDAAICDSLPSSLFDLLKEKPVKTMLIDGLTVDVSNADTAVATINTLIAARDAAAGKLTAAEAKAVTDAATIVAKDAQIAKLTSDKKALEDAKPTPAQLRDAARSFAVVVAKGKSAGVTVTDAMDEAAIMKAVVDKAMGDKAKDYTADHIAIAFEALTKDAKIADAVQPLGMPLVIDDGKGVTDARAAMIADMLAPASVAA